MEMRELMRGVDLRHFSRLERERHMVVTIFTIRPRKRS